MSYIKQNQKFFFSNKSLAVLLLFIFLFSCFFIFMPHVFAQYGLEETISGTPIAKGTIPQFVGTILKYIFGILGVILVALIIYGGVLYMTSAGSEEQTKTAKSVLTYAIVGVLIISLAFALTDYVLKTIINAGTITNETETTNDGAAVVRDRQSAPSCGREGDLCSKGARSLIPFVPNNCCNGYECSSNWRGTCEIPKHNK